MPDNLKIAIIAGGFALLGVVVSQVISIGLSVFDKRHKKNVLLRQKYEEMMFEFHASLRYVQEVQMCRTLDQLFEISSSPQAGKAYGLALLYFPELVDPLDRYSNSQIVFYDALVTVFNPKIPANAGAQGIVDGEYIQSIKLLSKYKEEVIDALIKNAVRYTRD